MELISRLKYLSEDLRNPGDIYMRMMERARLYFESHNKKNDAVHAIGVVNKLELYKRREHFLSFGKLTCFIEVTILRTMTNGEINHIVETQTYAICNEMPWLYKVLEVGQEVPITFKPDKYGGFVLGRLSTNHLDYSSKISSPW